MRQQLVKYVPEEVAAVLSDVVVEMSSLRRGGLFAITLDPASVLGSRAKGLRNILASDPLSQVSEREFLPILRLASLDGCTVIDAAGAVRNAGLIIDIPADYATAGEGARTAAASSVSSHGMAVKISQDGPISVYEAGKPVLVM